MPRLALWLALLLAGCGAPGSSRSSAAPPEDRASSDDARADRNTPSPPYAFRVSIPIQSGQVEYFEMTSSGELAQWVSPYERPEPPWRMTMRSDFALWDTLNDAASFTLRDDGALLPTHYEPDMRCSALPDGRVRCRCEGHVPVVDVTYSIAGEDLLASTSDATAAIGRVTPAPRNAAERLRVLVVIASWTYSRDDHGDSAHDVEY